MAVPVGEKRDQPSIRAADEATSQILALFNKQQVAENAWSA